MAGNATKRTVANLVCDINAIIAPRDAIHSTSMRSSLILCLAACACLSAQVRYSADQHAVTIDGKPFTIFNYGEKSGKPFLAPMRSGSGKIVTRGNQSAWAPGRAHALWFRQNRDARVSHGKHPGRKPRPSASYRPVVF